MATLSQKYGQYNSYIEGNAFWTDDTNSVGVEYIESNAINGNDRSFASMYYVNIELAEEFEESLVPDV